MRRLSLAILFALALLLASYGGCQFGAHRNGKGRMMSNETRERNIYLAKAMGWEYVPPGPETAKLYGEGVHCLRDPEGRFWPSPWAKTEAETWTHSAPWFHEWESAKAKLLRWLASDDNRWRAFDYEITDLWEPQDIPEPWSRFLVALTPAHVAESAEKALRGMERSI